jgi:phosphohistidine phosphatase
MKKLLLIRHAKSSWDNASVDDFDRPLNDRGVRDADEMSRRLRKKINDIDVFFSSPALRALSTAEKFAAAFNKDLAQIVFEQQLYLAPASFFERFVNSISNNFHTVAIFAHNPGITDFANTLTSSVKTDNIPTCGIFAVQSAVDDWKKFSTAKKELLFYDYPKLGA